MAGPGTGLEGLPIKYFFYFFRLFGFCSMHFDVTKKDVTNKRIQYRRSLRWTIISSLILFVAIILLVQACLVPIKSVTTFQDVMLEFRLVLTYSSLVVALIESILKVPSKIKFFEAIEQMDLILQKFNIQVSYKCRKYIVSDPRIVSKKLKNKLNILQLLMAFSLLITIPVPILMETFQGSIERYFSIIFQFEMANLLSTLNFIQIIFCAFLLELRFNSLHSIQNVIKDTPNSKLNSTTNDFNQFCNAAANLTNKFNSCFGWSILLEIMKDFSFFADGWYGLFTQQKTVKELLLIYTLWIQNTYVVALCVICERIHSKVRRYF